MRSQLDNPLNIRFKKENKKNSIKILILAILLFLVLLVSLFVNSSSMSISETFYALFNIGKTINIKIVQNIRLPRILTGLLCGFGLAIAGLIMQTCLNNVMASPSTLGISNAAILGANVAIIILSNGFVDTNNGNSWNSFNPYVTSFIAFVFSFIAILMILLLAKIKRFSPTTLILLGIAFSALFSSITTLIQYFATDIQLTSAIYWSFGDLGRTNYTQIIIMSVVIIISFIIFMFIKHHFNGLLLGDEQAKSLGIRCDLIRFIGLLLSSLIVAICISFVGVISFVGLISPHIARKLNGNNHSYLIPSSGIIGALILLTSDALGRLIMNGYSLPVGAITSLFGAPFFIYIVFKYQKKA